MMDALKERITALADACGPAGQEENVRELVKGWVTPLADEVREDVIGNLIATKKGTASERLHLLVVAHLDEPGLIVLHADNDGFLRVAPVGHTEAAYLVGQRVVFPNGVVGLVGTEHVTDAGDVTHARLYIDLGVSSKEEALELVKIGDTAALKQPAHLLAENRLVGKALDNRAGVAVAVEVLKQLGETAHDVTFVFTAQGQVGSRGIKPAAYGLQPDLGLVIDAVRTGDAPGAESIGIDLGKGVSVKILDRTVIIPPRIKNYLVDQAEAGEIPYQLEICPDGSSDAGALLIARDGVPTGGLSLPIRHLGSGSEMVDLRDAEAAVQLAVRALRHYSE